MSRLCLRSRVIYNILLRPFGAGAAAVPGAVLGLVAAADAGAVVLQARVADVVAAVLLPAVADSVAADRWVAPG